MSDSIRSDFGSHRLGERARIIQARRSSFQYFEALTSSSKQVHDVTTGADETGHGRTGRGVAIAVALSAVLWPVIVVTAWAL